MWGRASRRRPAVLWRRQVSPRVHETPQISTKHRRRGTPGLARLMTAFVQAPPVEHFAGAAEGGRGFSSLRSRSCRTAHRRTEARGRVAARRSGMRWLMEFYNERRGILARYAIEASLPAAAVLLGRNAALAEYPSHAAKKTADLVRAGRAHRGSRRKRVGPLPDRQGRRARINRRRARARDIGAPAAVRRLAPTPPGQTSGDGQGNLFGRAPPRDGSGDAVRGGNRGQGGRARRRSLPATARATAPSPDPTIRT